MKINYETLKNICLSPIESFKTLGDVVETKDGIYIYKSRPDSKILAVAHLDTVLSINHFHKIEGEDIVFNAQLDDRLGVYTLLDLLPGMGVKFDLLLTEGEETGQSTAAYFEGDKKYNWMFSFDRHGEDVVLYQYDDKDSRSLLQESGFKPSLGSFSDIAFLGHLGIKGFNFGTGYEGEHSAMCYANINALKRQAKRFVHFYNANKNTKLNHVNSPVYSGYYSHREYDDLYC